MKNYLPRPKLLAGTKAKLRHKLKSFELEVLDSRKCDLSGLQEVAAIPASSQTELNDVRRRASRVLIRMQYRKMAKRWDRLQTITLVVVCVAFPWLALRDTLYTTIGLSIMISMLFGVAAFIIVSQRKIRRLNQEYKALAESRIN